MVEVKEFEKRVIRLLAADALPPQVLEAALRKPRSVALDNTGGGYLLTIRHADLPAERIVCSTPLVTGKGSGVQAGFLVVIEQRELTLECHGYAADFPADYRENPVLIT